MAGNGRRMGSEHTIIEKYPFANRAISLNTRSASPGFIDLAAILIIGLSPGFQLFGFVALKKLFPNIEDECKKFDIQ
jgi:hypothetical protein